MKRVMACLLVGLVTATSQAEVVVTNLVVAQRPGTKLVDISYDVSSTETNVVTVSLSVSNGATAVACPNVSGDVGAGVATGSGKTIIWDGGADWNGNVASLLYTLSADDGISQVVSIPCPVPKTGQTTSYWPGDDGDLETGTAWPNPRFTDNGNGTVLDNLTGLEWIKAPHSLTGNSSATNWNSAIDFCNALNYAGHDDWRLPNVRELESLMHLGSESWGDDPHEWLNSSETPFSGVFGGNYWSSTSYASDTTRVWRVDMIGGYVNFYYKTTNYRAWPVRSRQDVAPPCPVPKTGQTTSYRTGDDGDLDTGTAWPYPRFTDNGDGTVLDNLSGLEWVQAPDSLSGNSGTMIWNDAIDFCNALNYAGHDDWRLPSRKELMSLIHFGGGSWGNYTYEWLNSSETPFSGALYSSYWSGTTQAYFTNLAWSVDTVGGAVAYLDKNYSTHVWPVRSQ